MSWDDEKLSISEKMDENRELIADSITPERVTEIASVLYNKAKEGDVSAIHLWLAYAAGEPDKRVNLESEIEFPPDEDSREPWQEEED